MFRNTHKKIVIVYNYKMFYIFTYATDEQKLSYLKRSAKNSNLNITYVMNDKWNGFVDKITQMQNTIKDLNDDDIICFIDAYDVIAFSEADEILAKFKEYDTDLLLSGELNCYPGENIGTYNAIYNKGKTVCPTNYKYVNSGGYIGYKPALMDLFSWKPLDEIHNICELGGDQNYFTHYYLEHFLHPEKRIKIDMRQAIFQSFYKVEYSPFTFVNGRLCNNEIDSYPCFVHFNGYGGYDYKITNQNENRDIDVRNFFNEKVEESKTNGEAIHIHGFIPPYFYMYRNIPQK